MSYPTTVLELELQEQAAARAGAERLKRLLPRPRGGRRLFTTTPTGGRDVLARLIKARCDSMKPLARLIRAMPTPPTPSFDAGRGAQSPSEAILKGFCTSQFREVGSIGRRNDVSPCAPRSYDDGR